MYKLALPVPLKEQGAAVAFLSTFSAIGKSRTRGSDTTLRYYINFVKGQSNGSYLID